MTTEEFLSIPEYPLFTYTEKKGSDGITVRTPVFHGEVIPHNAVVDYVWHDGVPWWVYKGDDGIARRQRAISCF